VLDPDTFSPAVAVIIAAFGLSVTQRLTDPTGAGRHFW
jgi:hypothetical protein